MAHETNADVVESLTGLCPFLIQDGFETGDDVVLTFRYDETEADRPCDWVPIGAEPADGAPEELPPERRNWGDDTVLVRATLTQTGGQPLDSMNRPTAPYDAAAVTLSDVTVLDRSPDEDAAKPP